MSDRLTDRHKTPRVYKSGFDKRKEKQQKKDQELLFETRRMTDFLIPQTEPTAKNILDVIAIGNENLDVDVGDKTILY